MTLMRRRASAMSACLWDLPFASFPVVEGSGGGAVLEAGQGGEIAGAQEPSVEPAWPVEVAADPAGVVGHRCQPGDSGEPVDGVETVQVAADVGEERRGQHRTEPGQAEQDLRAPRAGGTGSSSWVSSSTRSWSIAVISPASRATSSEPIASAGRVVDCWWAASTAVAATAALLRQPRLRQPGGEPGDADSTQPIGRLILRQQRQAQPCSWSSRRLVPAQESTPAAWRAAD